MAKKHCNTKLIPTFDYLRKSTKGEQTDSNGKKRERQEKSIAQQRAELDSLGIPRELADAGYEKFKIEGTFTDVGVSGWKLGKKRPGFHAMAGAIAAHPAKEKVIRVDDIDRFSRADIDETQEVAIQLKRAGVRWIVSAAQGVFHLGRKGNDIGEAIKFVVAAWSSHEYSRKLGRRVALARRNQAAEGKRPSAPLPYAMKSDDNGGLSHGDPDEIATLLWIYDQFATRGKSLRWVALKLNADGIPAPKGKLWYAETIKRLLSQRAYVGDFQYGERCTGQFYRTGSDGEVVEAESYQANGKPAFLRKGVYKPIVRRKLFDKAQKRLEGFKTGRKPRHDGYTLSRILRCDRCGAPMYGTTVNGGTVVYRCGSPLRHGKCEQYQIREDRILPGVMAMLAEEIDTLTAQALSPKPPEPAPQPETDQQIATLRERIATAEDRILDVRDKRTRRSLDDKITQWRNELDRLQSEQEAPEDDETEAVEQLQKWWAEFAAGAVFLPLDKRKHKDADYNIDLGPAEVEAILNGDTSPLERGSWGHLCDVRQLNEALHILGCEVRLRFKTEQNGKRRRHTLDRGRIRLGQRDKALVPNVTHGFPCMSYRPHSLARFLPTGCVWPSLLSRNHAYCGSRSLPQLYRVLVPARHAYSHSASVGRRYWKCVSISDSFAQKAVASSHDTVSTGRDGPMNSDGFSPVTLSYRSCVTSQTPR